MGPALVLRALPLGFLAGINLCPPFLLAVTTVFDAGGALKGMLFFPVFFVATGIYLLPLLFSGLASRFAVVRFAGRVAAVLAGAYFVFLGLRRAFARQHSTPGQVLSRGAIPVES